MKFLVAPNAFKNALGAVEVSRRIACGLKKAQPDCEVFEIPLADGGDGTLECLATILDANIVTSPVEDPLGRTIEAQWGFSSHSNIAIIEMALASGIALLQPEEYNPMIASTFGTGQLIKAAIEKGAKEIIVGLGGSATVDGGLGCLQALGFVILDAGNQQVPRGGNGLTLIEQIISPAIEVNITILSDVKNPLLGSNGSAAVFGPQKGADPAMVEILESGLTHFRNKTKESLDIDMNNIVGGGAAGGIAASLSTFLDSKIMDGANYIMDLAKVDDILPKVDYVITGEGKIDGQSDQGKAPYALAQRAKKFDKPVIALGGLVELETSSDAFDQVICINEKVESLEEAIADTDKNLERTAEKLGEELSSQ